MSDNIISLIEEQATGPLLEKLAALLGENPELVQKGLLTGSEALFGKIRETLSSYEGMDLFKSFGDGTKLDKLQAHLAGGNQTVNFLSTGLDKVQTLLGANSESVFATIAQESGLRNESVPFLMGVVHPMLSGVLGKQKATGLELTDIQKLLGQTILPSETSTPSAVENTKIVDSPADRASAAMAKAETIVVPTTESELKIEVGRTMKSDESRKKNKLLRFLIIFLILAVIAFLAKAPIKNLINEMSVNTTDNSVPVTQVQNTDATLNSSVSDRAGSTVPEVNSDNSSILNSVNAAAEKTAQEKLASLGILVDDKLNFTVADGRIIVVPESSIEAQILRALATENGSVVGKNYILDRVFFTSGSVQLTEESNQQINGIALLLSAYPDLNVEIRGYTDSHGSADKNFGLSKRRAEAVKDALVQASVESERIVTKAMGSLEPIASNASPEGRAKNRRIEFSLSRE